jgi:hypothetical protein
MMMGTNFFIRQRHIAPLAVLRMAFGAVLFISTVRFILRGWVHDFYVVPKYHFPFQGFEWLRPLPQPYMYLMYIVMAIAALFICLGFFYRIAAPLFFLCFTYAELIDKTYYLNHYYLVTILSFFLVLVPANRYFSLDVLRKPSLRVTKVPAWTILIFKIQLCIIYFFAGLSKLTTDWLINAMPLKIWLLAKTNIPVIGPFFKHEWVAYFFSWAGALFDLFIPFLLLNRRTRPYAYCVVIIFHTLTAVLFQIGMFPYFMITATLIFFSEDFHLRIIGRIKSLFSFSSSKPELPRSYVLQPARQKMMMIFLAVYFVFQIAVPLRFLFYPGKLLWTEEGYRFSWRVMLMEKSGTTFFYVKLPSTGRKFQVNNSDFLTPYQERMMETQPDMMLQYAHILKQYYSNNGAAPEVTVESYVSLNGTGSRLYIDSTINLANEKESWFAHKQWINSFTNK